MVIKIQQLVPHKIGVGTNRTNKSILTLCNESNLNPAFADSEFQ